jgi:hypothetical protein
MPEISQCPDGVSINFRSEGLLTSEEKTKRESYLKDEIGMSQAQITKLNKGRYRIYSVEATKEKIKGLEDRDFVNPKKMIKRFYSIVGHSFENIDAKILGLEERGCEDPIKMIGSSPSVIGYSFENIDKKISGLKKRHFNNPIKMIGSSPEILGLSFENIDKKISGLKKRHFNNPIKMIEPSPRLLGLSFDNIDNKIIGLKKRHFENPIETIESSSRILGLSFKNIDAKIELLSRLSNLYQLNLKPITIIESNLPMLGTKFEKLIVVARILREYQPSSEDIQRRMNKFHTINLESLLVSYTKKEAGDNIDNLIRRAEQIQRQKLTKDYKRQLIKDFFGQDPDSYKIYRDYLKGYPEKEIN